jgi:hypothetical protein
MTFSESIEPKGYCDHFMKPPPEPRKERPTPSVVEPRGEPVEVSKDDAAWEPPMPANWRELEREYEESSVRKQFFEDQATEAAITGDYDFTERPTSFKYSPPEFTTFEDPFAFPMFE